MTQTPVSTWLLNYEILRLVNQCRRLVDAEFGERPALSDADILQTLAALAGRSRSRGTQRVYAELRLALLQADDVDHPAHLDTLAPEAPVRMYRGQPVAAPAVKAVADDVTVPASPGKTITYRGRTVRVA